MKPFATLGTASVMALAAAWLAGGLAPDKGANRLILRVGLMLIVMAGAAVVAWFLTQRKKATATASSPKTVPGDQLDLILREAEAKLASAKRGPGTRIPNLPVYLFIGPQGSAKTTAVVQSGLEPELLAGEVYSDNAIASTPYLNFWYAKQCVIAEAADKLMADQSAWSRLIRHLAPGKLKSLIHQGGQAPRAMVVCLESEILLTQPLETNLTTARALRGRLSEFASSLGISVPVYVLFTKADKIPFFQEYVANLNRAEATQIFGATIPFASAQGGTYGEEQTRRLKDAYQELFYSLAGIRPDYLARERLPENTPAIYEFPREFRKLRAAAVPFLVELCRPSQLTIGPFLRGFYFCGVRPVVVQETAAAPAPKPSTRKAFRPESDATLMFDAQDYRASQPRADLVGSHSGTRKVPQWVFLTSVFKDVLLADSAALGTSGSSANTSLARRWLLGFASCACLLLSAAFLFSFANNRSLESNAIEAAEGIRASEAVGAAAPSLDALKRLETLRQSLRTLADYNRNGPPLGFRWFLFAGDGLYSPVRKLYFDRFQKLLLLPVQKTWVSNLRTLPNSPVPSDDYQRAYATLKGYLITTSHPGKSTMQFLPPLLETRWAEGRSPGAERVRLARKQFDFYSEELKLENPFSNQADEDAVKQGRAYLANFAGEDRVYNAMLVEANQNEKSVNFNADVKLSAEEVTNNKDVPGAFTKGGWARMQNELKNTGNYFNGESWVLGEGSAGGDLDRGKMEQALRKRYLGDFIGQWRDFLNRSAIVKYKDVKDAATKLLATSGSQSPLLALFHMASQNTAVDSPEVQAAFKPLYAVMPIACADYVCPANSDYMKELVGLQLSLEEIVAQPGPLNETSVAKTLDLAASARLKVRQMAQSFGIDTEGHLDQKMGRLLEDPIVSIPPLLRQSIDTGPLCSSMKLLSNKYPFSPKSPVRATVADLNSVFQPKEGALWKFYEANLQKVVVPQESQYGNAPGSPVKVSDRFLSFFNHAAAFSKALYPSGAVNPNLTFSMKPGRMEGLESITLEIDGKTLTYSGSGEPKAVAFNWPGSSREVKATTIPVSRSFRSSDLWAVYDFVQSANRIRTTGSISHLEYDIDACFGTRCGSQPGYKPSTVAFDLDMGPNPPIFQKGYFAGLGCVAEVVK